MNKKLDKLKKEASNSQVIIQESDNNTTSSDSETSIAESNSNSGTERTESDSNHHETSISRGKQRLKASSRSAIKDSNSDSTEELYKELTEKVLDLTSRLSLSAKKFESLHAQILKELSSCPEYVLPRSTDKKSTRNRGIANSSTRESKKRG